MKGLEKPVEDELFMFAKKISVENLHFFQMIPLMFGILHVNKEC